MLDERPSLDDLLDAIEQDFDTGNFHYILRSPTPGHVEGSVYSASLVDRGRRLRVTAVSITRYGAVRSVYERARSSLWEPIPERKS